MVRGSKDIAFEQAGGRKLDFRQPLARKNRELVAHKKDGFYRCGTSE